MKTKSLANGEKIAAIGLGTWSMGGGSSPAPARDDQALSALQAALDMGYTHIDTAEMYASGHTEELIGQAIRDFDRERLFITTKISPSNLRATDLRRSLEGSLSRLGTDYVDLYLIHWPSRSIPLEEPFGELNRYVEQGKIRHLGVSNFDLDLLQQSQKLAETPLATNQVPYSLFTRRYQRNGVLEYCQENGILLTAYSPLKDNQLKRDQTVQEIARQHGASPYQIALAWLVMQPQVITIPMSHNPDHLAANLAAAEITLAEEEVERLNRLA